MPSVEETETTEKTQIESRFCEQVRELERKCEVMEAEYEVAKAQASVLKKRLDESVASLRATIRRGPDAQQELPFREGPGWGETPIEEALKLTAKQLETLREADVATVDDFEALRAGRVKGYPRGLVDLPRVGQATVDKWENEILDWIGQQEQSAPIDESCDVVDDQDDDEEEV